MTIRIFSTALLSLLLANSLALAGCVRDGSSDPPDIVVSRLAMLLKDPDADVRRTAALSLGKIALPETAEALIASLTDADPIVRQYSAWALGNLGDTAIDQAGPALVERLGDSSPAVKTAAALALGNLMGTSGGTQAIVELLTEALRNHDTTTRRAAVLALTWLEAPSAYPSLIEALGDRDALVRQGALAALGELADVRTLPVMRDRLLRDPDPGVRSEAAFRLGKVGDDSVLSVLRLISLKDESQEVRRWASWAMSSIQDTTR